MEESCQLCHRQEARYTCPRCHVRYCSVACYRCREHESCSETFYRECFMEGLNDFNSTEDDKQKVVEMLKRLDEDVQEPEDSDDDDEPDLEERMAGLDLDTDTHLVWQRLTDREKTEFTKMVDDGRLSAMVPLWEPWWKFKDKKVEEVGASEATPRVSRPTLHHAPDLASLTKGQVSASIPFNIINIVYGYVYVARLHNGSHGDTPLQAMKEMGSISESLASRSFEDVPSAIHACLHNLQHTAKSSFVSRDFQVGTLTDVREILQGASCRASVQSLMTALSDIHHLARGAAKLTARDMKRTEPSSDRHTQLAESKKRWFSIRKKMEFLLSWCHKFGLQLPELAPLVDLEFCALSTEMARHQDDRKTLEAAWGGRRPPKMHRFIEEITDR